MKCLNDQWQRCAISSNNILKNGVIMLGLTLLSHYSHADSSHDWQNYQNSATQQFETGQYIQAMKNAQRALKLAEQGQGQTAPYIANSLNMMAWIAEAEGDQTKAIEYMQRAVQLFEKNYGAHENTVSLKCNLAQLYQKQNQPEHALNTLKQADEMLNLLWEKQQNTALINLQGKVLSEIQQVLLSQGKVQAAQHYAQRHYDLVKNNKLAKSTDSQRNLSAVRSLLILAQSYQQQNQLEKSNEILVDIFQRFEMIKSKLKPAEWYKDYADALEIKTRNYTGSASAEALHLEALAFYQQLTEPQQQPYLGRIANHFNELGFYYFDQAQLAEAERFFSKAQPIMQQAYGNYSAEYARVLTNLAQVKEHQSNFKSAIAYYQQAQQIYAQLLTSSNSPAVIPHVRDAYAKSLNYSAVLYYKQRQYQLAEQTWQQALALFEPDKNTQDQASRLAILENVLRLYQFQQRDTDAKLVQYQISQLKKSSS